MSLKYLFQSQLTWKQSDLERIQTFDGMADQASSLITVTWMTLTGILMIASSDNIISGFGLTVVGIFFNICINVVFLVIQCRSVDRGNPVARANSRWRVTLLSKHGAHELFHQITYVSMG